MNGTVSETGWLPILAGVKYPQKVQVGTGNLVTDFVLPDEDPAHLSVSET